MGESKFVHEAPKELEIRGRRLSSLDHLAKGYFDRRNPVLGKLRRRVTPWPFCSAYCRVNRPSQLRNVGALMIS